MPHGVSTLPKFLDKVMTRSDGLTNVETNAGRDCGPKRAHHRRAADRNRDAKLSSSSFGGIRNKLFVQNHRRIALVMNIGRKRNNIRFLEANPSKIEPREMKQEFVRI